MPNVDYNQWLLPYLEGTLDAKQTAEMDARLAADPSLAAEADRLRRTLDSLRQVAARTPAPHNAAPSADLWPSLRARLDAAPPPRRAAPLRLWGTAGASLAAAALIVAGVVWLPGHLTPGADSPRTAAVPVTQPLSPQVAGRAAGTADAPVPHPVLPAPAAPPPALSGQKVASLPPPAAVAPMPAPPMPTVPADPFALPKPPGTAAVNQITPHVSKPEQMASREMGPKRDPEVAGSYYATPPASAVLPAPVPAPLVPAAPMAAPPIAANSTMAARTAAPILDAPVPAPVPAASPKAMLKAQGPNPRAKTATSPVVTGDQEQSPSLGFGKPPAKTHTEAGSYGAAPTPLTLDDWQASLSAAMRPPLWGENAGMQQANQALLNAQMAGRLNDLRAQLEAQRGQSPSDIIAARMLAAVNEFGGSPAAALQVRRQTVTLDGTDGEDWFLLAQSEERAGNGAAAKAAYQHALASPTPPPPFHAAIARQRSQ